MKYPDHIVQIDPDERTLIEPDLLRYQLENVKVAGSMTPAYAVLCSTAVTHGLLDRLSLSDFSEMKEACFGVCAASDQKNECW